MIRRIAAPALAALSLAASAAMPLVAGAQQTATPSPDQAKQRLGEALYRYERSCGFTHDCPTTSILTDIFTEIRQRLGF